MLLPSYLYKIPNRILQALDTLPDTLLSIQTGLQRFCLSQLIVVPIFGHHLPIPVNGSLGCWPLVKTRVRC